MTRDRTPNHRLAALMREAGISNKGLARRMADASRGDGGEPVAPSHTNVDKWLSGETAQPKPRTCQVLVKVLSQVLGRPISLADVGYSGVPPEGADSTLEYPAAVADSITALAGLTSYDLRRNTRQQTLQVVPDAWAGLLVRVMYGSAAAPATVVNGRRLSDVDVQAVRDATAMFSGYDYRYGGGRPRPLVATYLEREVLPLIPHVNPDVPLGNEYFREAAALTRLAGWTAYDIGEHGLAQRYLWHAFRLAMAAGDKPLCARILAGMSHQANFLGHYNHAVHLARAAAHGAAGYATSTVMALCHAMEARALASQGNESEATVAIAAAEKYVDQSIPDNDPVWIRYFDRAELHAELAHCFRDLGKAELANYHAAASIAGSDTIYVRSLSFCRTVLATSYLLGNELEQALEVARGVVDTAAELRSFRVLRYVDEFRGRLGQYGKGAALRDFTEYVTLKLPSEGTPVAGRLATT